MCGRAEGRAATEPDATESRFGTARRPRSGEDGAEGALGRRAGRLLTLHSD
jgi:hypothetical protein